MSKLTVSIKKGAAAHGTFISLDVASHIAEHIEEGYVIIPRADLPKVQEGPHDGYVRTVTSGDMYESAFHEANPAAPASTPEWHRNHARHHIALAEWLEVHGTKARDKRRDELAQEFAGDGAYAYRFAEEPMKLAIDRIIDLEAAK